MNIIDAVIENNIDEVEAIINQKCDLNQQDDESGFTALHYCSQFGQKEMLELLLKNNAAVDIKDNYGNTPLFKAVFFSQGKTEIIKMLLDAGADPDLKNNAGVSPRQLAKTIASFDVSDVFDNE